MDKNMSSVNLYSPLVLAYIGDSVYEVYVRERILSENPNLPAYKLHRMAIGYVKAAAQAESIHAIESELSERELSVYKRGRNAKSATVPKNADVSDYRCATGLEALIGYLHLNGETERLTELMAMSYEAVNH